MKQHNLKLWAVFALMALFFAACQKDNTAEQLEEEHRQQQQLKTQRFLTLPPEPDTCLVRIAAELSKINNERTTLPHFADMFGYPKWDFIQKAYNDTLANYFIPLGNDHTCKVDAILLVYYEYHSNNMAFVLIAKNNMDEVTALYDSETKSKYSLFYRFMLVDFQQKIYENVPDGTVLMRDGDISYTYPVSRQDAVGTKASEFFSCPSGMLGSCYDLYEDEISEKTGQKRPVLVGGYCYCWIISASVSPLVNIGSNNNFPSIYDPPSGGGGGGSYIGGGDGTGGGIGGGGTGNVGNIIITPPNLANPPSTEYVGPNITHTRALRAFAANQQIKDGLNELHKKNVDNNNKDNTEFARLFTMATNGEKPPTYKALRMAEAKPNASGMWMFNLPIDRTTPIVACFHTHPKGTSTMFSPQDLHGMYEFILKKI